MWYLIKTRHWRAPYWLKSLNDQYWGNINGGRTPKCEDDIIYETAKGKYVDLDHTKTGLYVKRSEAGLLSPQGRWFPCPFHKHTDYANLILRMSREDLRSRGWVHVSTKQDWFCSQLLTEVQREWLVNHDHKVDEWDF